eukprot:TRINITY_DN49753_c0_g1_i1.p1 TRINITY_DN49753_c0_g1~~TRINITY_DN49753_c0_g1_i1.p1  ORF type:complete len:280 (-),score=61.90 TRINITY_DN49753_c0_g1_i1:27-866(-)
MWSGSSTTTTTDRALTIYVTNIADETSVEDVERVFSRDAGFCGFRAVGGGARKMVFVDYGTEREATAAMRAHQGQKLSNESGDGIKIDFDKDKRIKRSKAIGKTWGKGFTGKGSGRAPKAANPAGWRRPSGSESKGEGRTGGKAGKGKDGKGKGKRFSREREAGMFKREKARFGKRPSDFEKAMLLAGETKISKKPRPGIPSYLSFRSGGDSNPAPNQQESEDMNWEDWQEGEEEEEVTDDEVLKPPADLGQATSAGTGSLLAAYDSSDDDETNGAIKQ